MPKLIITGSVNGGTTIEMKGMKGKGCTAELDRILEAAGLESTKRTKTKEYSEVSQQVQQQPARQ